MDNEKGKITFVMFLVLCLSGVFAQTEAHGFYKEVQPGPTPQNRTQSVAHAKGRTDSDQKSLVATVSQGNSPVA